jgi:hypothetical protein
VIPPLVRLFACRPPNDNGHIIVSRYGYATDASACTFKQKQRATSQTRVRLAAILNWRDFLMCDRISYTS